MNVLVCGGRDFGDIPKDKQHPKYEERRAQYMFAYNKIGEIVHQLTGTPNDIEWLPICTIISGAAKGADSVAVDWAVVNWTQLQEYPADWNTHGKSAGFIRNQQMLDEGKPDLVIAFPGGRGTADMVRRARKAGVKVMEISYETKV